MAGATTRRAAAKLIFVEQGRRCRSRGSTPRSPRPPGGGHRTGVTPPAQAHPRHPGDQPGHVAGGDRRPARPSVAADDHGVCPDRRPHRGRRVLRRRREGRSALRRPHAAARRRRGRRNAQTPRGDAPADARQRLLRPTRRPGLPLRVDLRVVHVLPNHHRVPAHPAAAARRRRREGPARPAERSSTDYSTRLDADAS